MIVISTERLHEIRLNLDRSTRAASRHFTLTVPLSTQLNEWVPANLILGGNFVMD